MRDPWQSLALRIGSHPPLARTPAGLIYSGPGSKDAKPGGFPLQKETGAPCIAQPICFDRWSSRVFTLTVLDILSTTWEVIPAGPLC